MSQTTLTKQRNKRNPGILLVIIRAMIIIAVAGLFISYVNPARMSGSISKNTTLFTCAISFSNIQSGFVRALSKGWVEKSALIINYIGSMASFAAIVLLTVSAGMSLGEARLKKLSTKLAISGSALGIVGVGILFAAYKAYSKANSDKVDAFIPFGFWFFLILFALILLASLAAEIKLPKPAAGEKFEMSSKYRLLLMILPFVVLVVLFAYLPLWGWRYAFFDYKPGFELNADNFVGLKWFKYLFNNPSIRMDIGRVMTNTMAMSGIGLATSWLPMAFAIFLSEIPSNRSKRFIQTFTTIPNFISWVLVYSVAFALFSTDGFLNSILINMGLIKEGANYLMSSSFIWLKMWLWGTWKGLGWGAIIYISAISAIDQQLYEAATVDGAGRFKKMWHITVPSLLPTYFVLLLMSIANILSNGMDQYLVFHNAANQSAIQVLDLYVYQIGLASSSANIPLATLIGILKSIVSITLLFSANKISSMVRGESII